MPKSAGVVHCTIKRCCSGIANYLYPRYELYLLDTMRLMLTGNKQPGKLTGTYTITCENKTESPLGQLKSNFFGSAYELSLSGPNRENVLSVLYASPPEVTPRACRSSTS